MIGELIHELVQIPGPSGFEGRVASRLKELLADHVDEIRSDKIGNLIARKKGTEGKHALALVAHMDQVSMVVQKVDEFVWFDKLGWIDWRVLPSTPVLILGAELDIPGVVCATSAHFAASGEQKLWIDVGDQQDLVSVGDPIIFATPPRWLDTDQTLLASHSIDDRIGCGVLVDVARRLTKPPRHDIYFVGSVQEEIGSFGIRHLLRQITPDWLIAVDTCFAQDAVPDVNKAFSLRHGLGLIRLSFTQPADRIYPAVVSFASPRLEKLLTGAGKEVNVPVDLCVTGAFNDTSIVHEVNPEIDYIYLLIPRRYSHSPIEVVDTRHAERGVEVLCQAIADLDGWDE
jgi:endoglucanase